MERHKVVSYHDLTVLSDFHDVRGGQAAQLAHTVDHEDPEDVKDALRGHIVPMIRRLEAKYPGFTDRLKRSLQYFLNKPDFPIEAVYSANEPVLMPPTNPLNYYRWAWEVLFPGEEYKLDSLDGFVVEGAGEPP